MQKPTLILPVETKSREFHGKLWLALHLLREGYPVLFGEQSTLWNYCDLLPPSIYLDKSVASTRLDWFRGCRSRGHTVLSWDEEGLVFFDAWLYRKQRIDPEAFALVSRFFTWGEVQREAIAEEYPEFLPAMRPCGNPRFDLLRPELRGFFDAEVAALRQRFGRMLLVNTNFAFHNHFKPKAELQKWMAQYPINDEPGYMDQWIAMHREMHEAYLRMVPELIQRYPGHTIVLRPHPSESHAPWKELAKRHPRLHVDASGNVHNWILASEGVIHFNCTTGVEAYLLGVPAIAYRPKRYPRYENHLPNALSVNAFTDEALWQTLENRATLRESGDLWTKEQDETAGRYITGIDGDSACQRLCREINQAAEAHAPTARSLAGGLAAEAKRHWRNLRARTLRHLKGSDPYIEQKFPGIELREMRETLARLEEASGLRAPCRIRPFAKNVFHLQPRSGGS